MASNKLKANDLWGLPVGDSLEKLGNELIRTVVSLNQID
jgi:hypothetical protein